MSILPSMDRDRRPEEFDPFAPETIANPYPFYRALRTHAPVFRPRGADWWYVTRYADIKAVARDTDTYSSNIVAILVNQGAGRLLGVPNLPWLPVDVLAIADPPAHSLHRKVSTIGLGRNFPDNIEGWIEAKVERLVDRALRERHVDWMARVAFRLPMQVPIQGQW